MNSFVSVLFTTHSDRFENWVARKLRATSLGLGGALTPVNRGDAPRGRTTTIVMTPDAALELSIEQLVSALNKKLFMECARVQSAMSPMSRVQVAALTVEVRSREPKGNLKR